MPVVESGVNIADQSSRTPTGDSVRFRRVDLAHVPLKTRQAVGIGRWSIGQVTRLRPGGIIGFGNVVLELGGECRSRGGAFDLAVFDDARSGGGASGLRDRNADLRVAEDERSTRFRNAGRGIARDRRGAVEDDVVLHWAGVMVDSRG